MSTFDQVADLPLVIERYELEDRRGVPRGDFQRATTTIHLLGAGEEGQGEDVTYSAAEHDVMQAAGPTQPLAGEWTLRSFCEHVGSLELFAAAPEYPASILYRRWAFESAALDLALRQGRLALHDRLGIPPQPVTFVNSLGLGDPPTLEPVRARLERYPSLRFKLDATSAWDDAIFAALAETGAVDSFYRGTIVDQPADPVLYRRVLETFPDAWIEDAWVDDTTRAILEPHSDRLTWDAPIHTLADVDALPWTPRMVNVKPSRVGSLRELFDFYDACRARGVGM
jgi:hypothetical protein